MSKIFVSRIPTDLSAADVKTRLIGIFEEVIDVYVLQLSKMKNKGYAYVTFASPEAAQKALSLSVKIMETPLQLMLASSTSSLPTGSSGSSPLAARELPAALAEFPPSKCFWSNSKLSDAELQSVDARYVDSVGPSQHYYVRQSCSGDLSRLRHPTGLCTPPKFNELFAVGKRPRTVSLVDVLHAVSDAYSDRESTWAGVYVDDEGHAVLLRKDGFAENCGVK